MEVTRENFQTLYQDKLKQIDKLLNSSKRKNIVAFVGLTGSGKSTLINYLCRKELKVDEDDNIVLKNPSDQSAMQIGTTSVSETSLPKFCEFENVLFYDLPGFRDTRGVLENLLNSAIIKNIIENADTTIIVFVVSEDEIIAGRGKLFKKLLSCLEKLIPNVAFQERSALVITKSSPGKSVEDLVKKLNQKVDGDDIKKWHSIGYFAKMQMVHEKNIEEAERQQILKAIFNVAQKPISTVHICSTFDSRLSSLLINICSDEMEKYFKDFLLNILDVNLISSFSISVLEDKINKLEKSVEECQFEGSTLIVLLKTISQKILESALGKMRDKMRVQVDNLILQCTLEIENKKNENIRNNVHKIGFAVAGIALSFLFKKMVSL
ncbi:uncharacterized protein LOC124817601 [Hydra vulgaris]|uniref:uncharacterized protein LOC124817601 n=1 Tax=Hydra vulgaris TaxID=6087 RepID=UPI001F5EB8AB|nr:uncharacterized protein LOC124817601 [Hydra vulgaris]XP_047143840.1 uncharacterized protein LOC124817601 [Hydra vulgaris]XP_047143841.1 uncharacterized protein LOC124817601 [Hydra vulgaris]